MELSTLLWALQLGKVSPYLKGNMLHSQQAHSTLRLDRPGCASNQPCDLEPRNI